MAPLCVGASAGTPERVGGETREAMVKLPQINEEETMEDGGVCPCGTGEDKVERERGKKINMKKQKGEEKWKGIIKKLLEDPILPNVHCTQQN